MNFDKKKIIGLVLAVVAVVLVVSMGSVSKKQNQLPSQASEASSEEKTQIPSQEIPEFPTREAPPSNVVVPDIHSSNIESNVAKPEVVAVGNPAGDSSYRSFNVKIENGAFVPDTIIVYEKDTTDINVMAVDGDYDFAQPDYGFSVPIKKGETKKIQFNAAAAGKFMFYCASCGGPEEGPRGYIVVANKK